MSEPSSVRHLPPRGHYLAHEVGRLAGISGHMIGQWARRGYIRSSQSAETPRVYSFQDVAEAMVVHELLDRGVSHRQIRSTITSLRGRYGHDWPLTHARLATEGGRVVTEADEAFYDTGKRGWQQLNIDESDLKRIVGELQRGGWAARTLPDLTRIEVDPGRLSGRPVIKGTRVPAELVAQLAETARGRQTLREGYDLNDADADDALRWWRATQEFLTAAA
jgi:uncharacterized protein (DUF433 family)